MQLTQLQANDCVHSENGFWIVPYAEDVICENP